MKVQGQTYLLNVGIADNLPSPVVLGYDLPILLDLIPSGETCNLVITRAQAKSKDDSVETLSTLPFYDEPIETKPVKPRKSRRQRRREKFQHSTGISSQEPEPDTPLGFKIPGNVIRMQRDDSSLTSYIQRAKGSGDIEAELEGSASDFYFLQQGVLYLQQGSVKQLLVPKVAREMVLTLGHSIPWAGRLGKHKTTARITRHFYWPGLRKDVAQFCRSCSECQQTSIKSPNKSPLQPLPVIGTPFERIGMDIIGPVEKSKSGNRLMLVITDYANRYPEVFPLKTVKAKTIAYCLVQFFAS